MIDETFQHYLGLYNGKASQPQVAEAVEGSDCLLSIGYRILPRALRSTALDA